MPASLAFAALSGRAPAGLQLTLVELDREAGVTVEGRARGDDRVASMELLELYHSQLSRLDFLGPLSAGVGAGRPRPAAAGPAGALPFRLQAGWRR
jgi:hypothetical protein